MVKEKKKTKKNVMGWQDEVQTRNEEGELRFFKTLNEAFDHAEKDKTVWKISFSFGEERVRLVRKGKRWVYEDILGDIKKAVKKALNNLPEKKKE
jgi:hypothetical protein